MKREELERLLTIQQMADDGSDFAKGYNLALDNVRRAIVKHRHVWVYENTRDVGLGLPRYCSVCGVSERV